MSRLTLFIQITILAFEISFVVSLLITKSEHDKDVYRIGDYIFGAASLVLLGVVNNKRNQ